MSSASSSPPGSPESSPTSFSRFKFPQAVSGRSSGEDLRDSASTFWVGKPFNFAEPVTKSKLQLVPQELPDPKRNRFEYEDTFTVIVGSKQFIVHTEPAAARSEFFSKALLGSFKEAKEATVHLPEVEADTFRSYVHWLYTGNVVVSGNRFFANEHTLRKLTDLYIAADMLLDLSLRNATTDALLEALASSKFICPTKATIELTWSATLKTSTIRKVYIDYFQAADRIHFFSTWKDTLPAEFLSDVLLAKLQSDTTTWGTAKTLAERCQYHEHNSQVPNCGSKAAADGDNKTELGKDKAQVSNGEGKTTSVNAAKMTRM